MIKCSFCQNSKALKYLFTLCKHLVCLNCASLRVYDGVKCCNIITQIDSNIKQELLRKKVQILRNLQNSYQDGDSEGQEQRHKDHIAQNNQHFKRANNKKNRYMQYSIGQQKHQKNGSSIDSTPMDKSFHQQIKKNQRLNVNRRFILQANEYIVQDKCQNQNINDFKSVSQSLSKSRKPKKYQEVKASSPIKCLNDQKCMDLNMPDSNIKFRHSQQPNRFINKHQLQEILLKKIKQVKQQFRLLKNQVCTKQDQVLANLQKVYVQKVNVINLEADQIPNQLLKRQQMAINLQQIIQQYSFKQLREQIIHLGKKQGYKNKSLQPAFSYLESNFRVKGIENNYQMTSKNSFQSFKPEYKDLGFHFNSGRQDNCYISPKKHIFQNPLSIRSPNLKVRGQSCSQKPNKQLQKIYKKLDQSRSKLQQRIQKHNTVLSQRHRSQFA